MPIDKLTAEESIAVLKSRLEDLERQLKAANDLLEKSKDVMSWSDDYELRWGIEDWVSNYDKNSR